MSIVRKPQSSSEAAVQALAWVCALSALFLLLLFALNRYALSAQEQEQNRAHYLETDAFYALLIGSDSRKGTALYTGEPNEHAQVDQHADVIMLLRIDVNTSTLGFVTLPVNTVTSQGTKLSDELSEDGEATQMLGAVEELCGISIPYYFTISFSGFEAVVDALGGVLLDVPFDLSMPDPLTATEVSVRAGNGQLLSGAQALLLLRSNDLIGEQIEMSSEEEPEDVSGVDDVDAAAADVEEAGTELVDAADAAAADVEVADAAAAADVDDSSAEEKPAWQQTRRELALQLQLSLVQSLLSLSGNDEVSNVVAQLANNVSTNMEGDFLISLAWEFYLNRDQLQVYACNGPEPVVSEEGVYNDTQAWADLIETLDEGKDPSSN